MDSLRYFIIPITTATGVIGFLLDGSFVWLGIATFPVLLILDVLLPADIKSRRAAPAIADFALYLQLPLLIAFYGAFAYSVIISSNAIVNAPESIW